MKKVALVVAVIGCMVAGNYSFGQDVPASPDKEQRVEKSPLEKAEKRTEKMTEELGLSAEQADEIRQLNIYHIQEMDEIRQQMKALKAEAKSKREAHRAKMDKVLTEEQRKIMDEKMAAKKAKHEERKKQCDHQH